MSIYSKLRRTIVSEGQVYKINDLFGGVLKEENIPPSIDNPEFYDVSTHTLKLGNLCKNETDKNVNGDIEWNNNKYTTYCALLQLSNTVPTGIKDKLHRNIDVIYDFLRRDLSLDNRRKFHSLIKVIFNYDNQANTIELIADYIKKTDSAEEIRKSLDLFRKEDIQESDIENFLKRAKFTTYKEYENSFVGDHFNTKEYKLFLKYRSEHENRTMYTFIKDVIGGKMEISDAVAYLHQSILENYSADDMAKGDLVCKKPLYNSKGYIIIDSGDIVEVKKLDHAGDSYLSEFFAIYKDSKLPKDAFEPQFLKVYNTIIDGLFNIFKSTGKNILEDIKSNFAGIIYDENVFIPSKDIELYWSNKGRGSCTKDHRLSIRYRINKPSVPAYVYQKNNDTLTEKTLTIQLDKELIFCPITKSRGVNEGKSNINITNLLTEGRKEDAKVKYPQFSDEIFNFYVENDPSGNQKYLNWMLKSTISDSKQYDRVKNFSEDYHNQMVDAINYFHNNLQRFENRDINSYSDLSKLEKEINKVKSVKTKKEQKIEGAEKIFEDKNLIVVVPNSIEGSCLYGSETKWCVSARESNFFTQYRQDGILFFLLWKLKMPEHLKNYQKIARYIPHGYSYETQGEYFLSDDTRMDGSDIETMLFGKRTTYNKGIEMKITSIPKESRGVYDSWSRASIVIDTYYAKNGMNLPNTRRLDDEDDFIDFNDFMSENLVLEGRKEDARAKYPDVPNDVFDFYVDNDPSGNQKYLDWLLKYFLQVGPSYLIQYIEFFHQHQNMFIEKDINRHTPTSLDREIDDVKEKLLQKEKKKQAKKQSTKIYEDDRWLVISPKSWEASCYYGAGTKWCITMKDNPSYWRKYSKNASFFFIIDKTKPQDDPLYKVAYRKIGRRGKYELWNAPDHEISRSGDGEKYFEQLPEEMKERINDQHLINFPVGDEKRSEWVEDNPRAQAILNGLDVDYIEDAEDYYHGMPVFLVDDEYYAVGGSSEMDEALRDHYDGYGDDDLMEYYDWEGYYLRMEDEDDFIDNEVSDYIDNMSDREKLESAGLLDKESELESEIEEFESKLEGEEDEEKIEFIESELKSLRKDLNELPIEATETISDWYRKDWERCLRDGPKECFIDEKGWYRNARELFNTGLVYLDRVGLIDSLMENGDWEVFLPYNYDEFQDDEDGYWYVFKVDY
jgi:hypothetical protein